MIARINDLLRNLRQPMYSRAVIKQGEEYIHTAGAPIFCDLTTNFLYFVGDVLYEGIVHNKISDCTYEYRLPTAEKAWEIIPNYVGAFTLEELFEKITIFNSLPYFYLVLSDTVTEKAEREIIEADMLVFSPQKATNESVNNSNLLYKVILKLLEIFHLKNIKYKAITELPTARLHENLSGEYIIYKGRLEIKI